MTVLPRWYVVGVLWLVLCTTGVSLAQPRQVYDIDLPAGSVSEALNQLSEQTGVPVVFPYDLVKGKKSNSVVGRYTLLEAMDALLRDTGLSGGLSEKGVLTISQSKSSAPQPGETVVSNDPNIENTNKARSARPRGIAAFFASVTAALSFTAQGTDAGSSDQADMSEVLVTAEKREERQQDVPIAMTVINPDTLAENGQNRLIDYFASVPGLNVNQGGGGAGTQYLTIRGLGQGPYYNATVAVVVDDVLTGSSNNLAFGPLTTPDIDPSDLDRIEVLKGPQGTLYGADSLGGLIKYVTKDPSTAALSGRVEVDGSSVLDGGQGYGVRGAVNIPVSDTFSIGANGFARRDPGYIDDLTTGQKNINSADVYGGRIAGLWRPSNDISLKLSALVQRTDGNGTNYVNSNSLGQFTQGALNQTGLPGTGTYTTQEQLYSATFKAKVAGVDVVSVTGYSINELRNLQDFTADFGGALAAAEFPGTGAVGSALEDRYETDKFSQEIRVSSSIGRWLDWLVGGFYTHERSPDTFENYYAETATGSQVGGQFLGTLSPITLSEYAVFSDLTVHFTDQFDVQLGGREGWNKQTYGSVFTGPIASLYYGSSSYVTPTEDANGHAFTYLVTPEFKLSPDLMIYARVASGYRIGGSNYVSFPGTPPSYKPDTTTNYELGIKGELPDRRLTFDAAAYYISWKDFQISVDAPVTSDGQTETVYYVANAGNAKSEGLEASLQARPVTGLTITAQGSYNHAVLTQDFSSEILAGLTYGKSGDPLPYSIRWTGGLTIDQDIHLANAWTGFIGGTVNYIGSYEEQFTRNATIPRAAIPGYTTFNLHTGARHDSWLINLYLNNVGDKHAILGINSVAGLGITGGYSSPVIQPRTLGLSVVKQF